MECGEERQEARPKPKLQPEGEGQEENGPVKFQNVGTGPGAGIARCQGLAPFRRQIARPRRQEETRYTATDGDEVEDLRLLLADVQAALPGVDAVCCGAVLSNYQRCRVEHVCADLGLASLAYLWQREQRDLLGEMIDAGVDAIVVKVGAPWAPPLARRWLRARARHLPRSHSPSAGRRWRASA